LRFKKMDVATSVHVHVPCGEWCVCVCVVCVHECVAMTLQLCVRVA